MRSAERLLASEEVEDLGLACAHLSERYYKAALYCFRLDRTVIPYLKAELRKRAHWYAKHEGWSKKAVKVIEEMICICLYDLEKGGRTTAEFRGDAVPVTTQALRSWRSVGKRSTAKEKAEALGVARHTWYRYYAKPYEALYADIVGWATTGRAHIFRMDNYEKLMD